MRSLRFPLRRRECTHLLARLYPVVHFLRVVGTCNLRDVVDYVYVVVDCALICVLSHINLLSCSTHLPLRLLHSNALVQLLLLLGWRAQLVPVLGSSLRLLLRMEWVVGTARKHGRLLLRQLSVHVGWGQGVGRGAAACILLRVESSDGRDVALRLN